jgi:hypothetical protein
MNDALCDATSLAPSRRKPQKYRPAYDVVLALGMVIYPGTQLRLRGIPLGPGEVLLVIWLLTVMVIRIYQPKFTVTRTLVAVVTFWLIVIFSEAVGMIVGLVVELFHDWSEVRADVIAYLLIICLSLAMSNEFVDADRRRRMTWLVTVLGAVSLSLQALGGYGFPNPPGVDPWYFYRLRGWAHDPNQLGLFAAVITLLAICLLETTRYRLGRATAAVCIGISIVVGYMTDSDTYKVCILVATAVFLVRKSLNALRAAPRGLTMQGAAAVLSLICLPLATLAIAPFGSLLREQVVGEADFVYAKDNQGDARIALWLEAADKAMASGMLGMGPGPHLTEKSYKEPPPHKFEAHNTPLQLLTQGGFLAMFAFVGLLFVAFQATWRARLPGATALVCGLIAFTMFHFVARHPIFWFPIVLCMLDAAEAIRSAREPAPEPASRLKGALI